MKYRSLWHTGTTIAAAATLAGSARAQSANEQPRVEIARLEVQLWPEYDDPRVLGIYSGELDSAVSLPAAFRLIIPRGAEIHMAGAIGEGGQHLHALYQTRPLGDSLLEVSYDLQVPSFYMEFYYDPFENGRKAFDYPLQSPFPVASLQALVQQPLAATDFRVTPPPLDVVRDGQGFSYDRLSLGALAPNEARTISVSYVKPDDKPSVAAANSGGPAGGTAMKNILIIGAIALAGAVAYGVFASRSRARRPAPRGAKAARAAEPVPQIARAPSAKGKSGVRYCTACGEQLEAGDRFCAVCGAAVRKLA